MYHHAYSQSCSHASHTSAHRRNASTPHIGPPAGAKTSVWRRLPFAYRSWISTKPRYRVLLHQLLLSFRPAIAAQVVHLSCLGNSDITAATSSSSRWRLRGSTSTTTTYCAERSTAPAVDSHRSQEGQRTPDLHTTNHLIHYSQHQLVVLPVAASLHDTVFIRRKWANFGSGIRYLNSLTLPQVVDAPLRRQTHRDRRFQLVAPSLTPTDHFLQLIFVFFFIRP